MKCIKCSKDAKTTIPGVGSFCNKCYCTMIEKRIRKDIRLNKYMKKDQKVVLLKENTAEFFLTEYVLKNLQKSFPFKLGITEKPKKEDILITPLCMDDLTENFLTTILENKPEKKKILTILGTISKKEVTQFAKIKEWKTKTKEKTSIAKEMLNNLEEKYPNIKFALTKSMEELQNL